MNKKKAVPVQIKLPHPGNLKPIGGGEADAWNDRIMRLVISAMPVGNKEDVGEVGTAVVSGMLDINAADPIEGMLVSQLVVASEAALSMFRRAWLQPDEYFEARCRYLALADRAQRTVALLTERLDHHRGRGQQQITVKHVTVNADQAIVGNVEHHQGGGSEPQSKEQPQALTYAPGITVPSTDQGRELLPVTGDEKRAVPDARRYVTRRIEGK